MDAVQIIILVVVVLLVVALVAALMSRRKRKRVQLAEEHRSGAREELRDLHQQRAEADAAEKRAAAVRAEAERAEAAAAEARQAEQVRAARAEDRVREADRLDPRVDHKSDDYDPQFDRVTPGDQHSTGTTGTGTHGAGGSERVDPETGRPLGDDRRL